MQGRDVAAAAPDPKEDGKRPSHPPAQAAGSLPSRSVRSTPGDPLLLANKNVLGRGSVGGNLLGAPGSRNMHFKQTSPSLRITTVRKDMSLKIFVDKYRSEISKTVF